MVIREMSNDECFRVLAGARLARLGCAIDNQPYVVPVYLAFYDPSVDVPCFYGFTTLGQKVEWMRANPLVCVEVDEIVSCTRWISVVAFGSFEELPHLPELNVGHPPARRLDGDPCETAPDESARTFESLLAYRLLQTRPMWWEPASTSRMALAHHTAVQAFNPIYFKISIDRATGREATSEGDERCSYITPQSSKRRFGWLRKMLASICRFDIASLLSESLISAGARFSHIRHDYSQKVFLHWFVRCLDKPLSHNSR